MKTLPPQPLRDVYWSDIEAQLKSVFYEIVFYPVMDILRKVSPHSTDLFEIHNAGGNYGPLLLALRSGRVQYTDGKFTGNFSVAISRDLRAMGATFDHRSKEYVIPPGSVPEFVRLEATNYRLLAKGAHDAIQRKLDDIQKNLEKIVEDRDLDSEETMRRIDRGFQKSAALLEVQPKIDAQHAEELAKDYNRNMKLYIKDFSKQSIDTLREAVEDNAQQGYRFDRLTEVIRHRYGVTANKAKFLARQETSLFMSKYRKQRFAQAGVRRYKWSTAHDERVRDSHKRLDGQIFAYDQPPIVNRNTGEKGNPGEDFNCRCLDIPVLEHEASFA